MIDEVECASIEGFLQSLKCPHEHIQVEICKLAGRAAKFRGKKYKWQKTGKLYWKGMEIDRYGKEYQELLDRAFWAMAEQSDSFRKALLASGDAVFTHSIGKNRESETVLTVSEFCGRLMKIREMLRKKSS